MTLAKHRFIDAPAAHFDFEPFRIFAHQELERYPLVPVGVCLNPMCSQEFEPTRPWQRYCCDECRKMDEAEMRRIGQKAAPALLAHRIGKNQKTEGPLKDLGRAGRNYITRLQSEWYEDRLARAAFRRR